MTIAQPLAVTRGTLDHYDVVAADYARASSKLDMSFMRNWFLESVPSGGSILDLGSGSGRDSRAFLDMGYEVTAIDGSAEMCGQAALVSGIEALHLRFDEIDFWNRFDGIWARASLLHVPAEMELDVYGRLKAALRPNGVLYVSYKIGNGERMEGERFFRYHDEESMKRLIKRVGGLEIVETIENRDGQGRPGVFWINALIVRR
jgi:SAM-dependent methyltransferase